MNKLTILLLELFKTILKNIAVKYNNTEYSYEYILNTSKNFAVTLNELSSKRLRIALVASNSIEWIIIFLGIIFSKHQLILFSPNLSKTKLYHVLQESSSIFLITDIEELNPNKLTTVRVVMYVKEITFNTENITPDSYFKQRMGMIDEEDVLHDYDDGIIVYTPRKMDSKFISYNTIVDILNLLLKKDIYIKCSNYVCYQDFTYNYTLCILLPFIYEITIIIPNEPVKETAYFLKHNLLQQKTETIILTGYQFELLWREYVENRTDIFTEFLSDFKFRRLARWRIKKHLKDLFPNIEKLIILNSNISYEIETTLKRINFPYTITYGTVETCGIATYSDPKDFIIHSCGKRLPIPALILDQHDRESGDDYRIDDNNILFFKARSENIIKTEFGFTISNEVENILKSLPLVIDCMLIQYEQRLILLVNIDKDYCDYKGYKLHDINRILNGCSKEINEKVHSFEKIDNIQVVLTDFKRDSYGRILKDTPL